MYNITDRHMIVKVLNSVWGERYLYRLFASANNAKLLTADFIFGGKTLNFGGEEIPEFPSKFALGKKP